MKSAIERIKERLSKPVSEDVNNILPSLKKSYANNGWGVYVVFFVNQYGLVDVGYCPSGNNIAVSIEHDPASYLTEPLFVEIPKDQYDRLINKWTEEVENF